MINEKEGEFKFPKVRCGGPKDSPRYQLVLIVSDYTVGLDKNKNISLFNIQFENNFFALSGGFGQTLPSFLSINKLSQ